MKATEIEEILTTLAQNTVEFVVIGGAAALAHGAARVTFDVDVCYNRTASNIARLCAAVAPLNPTLRGAPPGIPFRFDVHTVKAGLNFTLDTDLGSLDLLGEVAGLGEYPEVSAVAETHHIYGFDMQVISISGLITAKRAAGRTKDQEAILELEALLEMQEKRDK